MVPTQRAGSHPATVRWPLAAIHQGELLMSDEQAVETMKTWLDTKFEGGRHERRVKKIDET